MSHEMAYGEEERMATILQGTCSRSTIVLTTEFGRWELPNDLEKQNKKSLSIFLRACCHPETGKPLFTYQQIADALGYNDRQDTNNFWRQFEASGKQFRDFLQRKMKVDDTVVDAVEKEVRKDLLASASTLCERVSQKLDRPDLTEANIQSEIILDLCQGEEMPFLIDFLDISTRIDDDARRFFAIYGPHIHLRKAQAIVVNSMQNKLLINFYIKHHKPKNPTKLFDNIEDALDWINKFFTT